MLILFGFVVSFFFIYAYIQRKDFSSPTFLLSVSFLLTALVFFLNIDNWELEINGKMIAYVSTAMVAFSLGASMVRLFSSTRGIVDNSVDIIARLKGRSFIGLAIISVLCTSTYTYIKTQGFSNLSDFTQMLRMVYLTGTSTNESNVMLNQIREIPIAIAYVCIYFLLFAKDKKIYIRNLDIYISQVSFFVLCIFSTDRNIFLRYVAFTVCLWIIFYKNRKDISKRKKRRGIVKKVILVFSLTTVVAYGFGKAKGYASNFERAIGIYAGSGLYNYNLTIESNEPLQLGGATFRSLTNTFKALIGERSNEVVHGTFITYRSGNGYVYSSNIFSALKPYTRDFGYLGVIIFPLFLGFFFEILFQFTKKRKYGFSWILYSMCVYPLLYFCIAEQFFGRMHMGRVYEIFWVVVFYYAICRRRVRVGYSFK